jgi:hypothetical protein
MNIAVFTRGFERDFEWKYEGRFADGESDSETRRKLKEYGINDQIKIDVPGLAVARRGDAYGVLITGVPTRHRRPAGGLVSASFAFFDLDENVARKLATGVLRDWINATERLVPSINRHSPPPSNPEWSFDVEQIGELVKSYGLEAIDPICDDRVLRPYSPPDNNGFVEYSELVSRQIFSSANGIKVVICKSYPRNGEADFPEADIVILPGLSDLNSPKKRTFTGATRSTKSKLPTTQPLQGTSPSPSCLISRSACWMSSNKGWVIICGVVAIGILLEVTCKKKDVEPPIKAIHALDGKAVQAPNPDEMTPVDTDKLKGSPEETEPTKP